MNNDATTQRLHYKNQLEKTETGNIWNVYVKIWSEPSKLSFFGKKNPHLGFSQEQKLDYEKKNPLGWEENRCIISDFPLDVNTKGIEAGPAKITYYDFIMIKECKFCKPFLKNRS